MIEPLRYTDLPCLARPLICNGAGPRGLGWLVPDLWFRAAANRHDFDYWVGGGVLARLAADLRFLANCLLAALDLRPAWRLPGAALLACIYFLAVAVLGPVAFHWGRPRGWPELRTLLTRVPFAAFLSRLGSLREDEAGLIWAQLLTHLHAVTMSDTEVPFAQALCEAQRIIAQGAGILPPGLQSSALEEAP